MVRHKLDSVNECARKGYDLRITCRSCGRSSEVSAVIMMQELAKRSASMALTEIERRAKCRICHHRGATVMPTEIDF